MRVGLIRALISAMRTRRCRRRSRIASTIVVACSWACSGGDGPETIPSDHASVEVDIGLPGGDNGLEFMRLEPGQDVLLETFGQGGTHILLAVRCSGFGNRAFVNVSLTNLQTGARVVAPPPASPQLLLCRDERNCDLLPLFVMTGGLTAPGENKDGVPIRIDAEVNNVAGARARVEREAVLRTE